MKRFKQKKDSFDINIWIAVIFLIFVLIMFLGYFLFFNIRPIEHGEQFFKALQECEKVSWVKEDAQASWLYIIQGETKGDACKIKVKLLKMKQGTSDTENLQGKEMICIVQKEETQFPEKEISKCSGELKEELQDIIIQRMHKYILQNIEELE